MLDDWDIPEGATDESASKSEANTITIEQCLAAGSDGIDISNEHYHAVMPGISGSNLSLLAESNKHLDNKELFNLGESNALTFGTLLHTMVLEPHDTDDNYAVLPPLNLRTNTGKAEKLAFEEEHEGKIIIPEDDFETATNMTKNVMAICGDIINKGVKEKSYFVRDDDLILKIRPDCYFTGCGSEFDLKSITPKYMDMSDRALERHIVSFGYHISAGYRNYVRKLLGMPTGNFYLLFVSTSPGHMVRNVRIADAWIEESEFYVKELLESRKFYLGTGLDKGVSVVDRSSRKYEN
ncbi:MAG: PD-(D/E)XK nuclease-like domain-containing protein [Gammaproteobacteria bacterium]|nr:PD-(D/E)XK nuclease-like domain-containing protein [Gammaproteobacteria bacterium]